MPDQLDISKRKKGDVVVLDLSGNLTLGAPEQTFKDMIADLVARKQTNILVNLQGVEFMDSSGVGALVKSFTTLSKNGGKLKLLQAGKFIQHTLKLTGLIGLFELFDDEAAALSSF
jgi:anti-sigma B factor antagonist